MVSLVGLGSTNWSYYTIPVAFILCMVPHAYAIKLAGKNYDVGNPRKTVEHCAKDTSLDKVTVRRISRGEAATANGFETLGLYAAGVVAGNVAGVAAERMNQLTLGYLLSRVVYSYIYVVLQDNSRFAGLRSLVWMAGAGLIMALFVAAGQASN
ncbi:hypothetical protein N657DRAFT_412900 [Parathielavia appendiculata]|uniref:MAPEG family protein n=1 Tax=Parathielavia appendiculata TaxID=2587402 RepID=A0AAN6TZJ4_9PEZI|nr:hypothetical protein N657DRAFT_412900 [Parathielavia appendiculata]